MALIASLIANSSSSNQSLASHFREEKAERAAPWKRLKAELFEVTKTWDAAFENNAPQAWREIEEEFAAAGKNGLLQVEAATELAYLLACEKDRYRRARAILSMTTTKQLQLHNFTIASKSSTAFEDKAGPMLEALPVPLFPIGNLHKETNDKMIAEWAGSTVRGGGAPRQMSFSAFLRTDVTGAGYRVRVEDGEVDLTVVENNFDNLCARVAALEHSRGRGRGNNNSNNYNNNRGNSNNRNNNRGRGGNRGYQNQNRYYGAGADPNEEGGEETA